LLSKKERESRARYWMQVRLCLLEFHSVTETEADKTLMKFMRDFPFDSEEPEVEILYHTTPFSLACEITGKNLSLKERSLRYKQILDSTESNAAMTETFSRTVKSSLLDVFKESLGFKLVAKRQRTESSSKSKSKGGAVLEPVPSYTSKKGGTRSKPVGAAAKAKPKTRTPKKAR
jgi:hypothetical protein